MPHRACIHPLRVKSEPASPVAARDLTRSERLKRELGIRQSLENCTARHFCDQMPQLLNCRLAQGSRSDRRSRLGLERAGDPARLSRIEDSPIRTPIQDGTNDDEPDPPSPPTRPPVRFDLLTENPVYKPFRYPWAYESGSASSASTGCPRKCRWARTCKDWAPQARPTASATC